LPTCDVRIRLATSTIISVLGATTTLRVQISPTVMAFVSTRYRLAQLLIERQVKYQRSMVHPHVDRSRDEARTA
jgi:hypothetical protein